MEHENEQHNLAEFPHLYAVDSRYGEDVRRISLVGQLCFTR
ncbi:protein of unknown function [Xenorhabdus poinarii G6]|uniref:Uncharacterized protein n=1 Tax=Xenorhabdus poinarii G6 TaxID=1354304 RepID=A0A068R103_9GAMM|nr:protein of unknown function [Xenorhabdus poinarii G6]